MISKSLTFPIQAFIALAVINSSLTSSVSAAAAIAPARFARDPRPVSVPTPMMARLNKARDFPNANLIAIVNSCTGSTDDLNCLVQGGAVQACESQDPDGSRRAAVVECLGAKCPNTPFAVFNCVVDPNQIKVAATEIGILNPCTTDLQPGDITCLKDAFRSCALINDNNNTPNKVPFGDCMINQCPRVSSADIKCIATNFGNMFTQSS